MGDKDNEPPKTGFLEVETPPMPQTRRIAREKSTEGTRPTEQPPPLPEPPTAGANHNEHIMQFFAFEHLPEHLQGVSKPFAMLAVMIVNTLPRNPERTVALRKLLEAKDAAVRARLAKP